MANKAFIVSRVELARLANCTPDRITKHIAEGLPVVTTGGGRGKRTTIDLAKAIPWLLKRRATDEERARYFRVQADRVELDYRQRAGQLLPAADVEATWTEIVVTTRNRFLSIPHKLKAKHPDAPNYLLAAVDSEIRDGLAELADVGRRRQIA